MAKKYRKLPFIYRWLKPFEKNRRDKVAEMIKGSNLAVLEIGCADGQFLFDNRLKWKNIVGVDIGEKNLLKAKKRSYNIQAQFQSEDYGREKMPYKTYQFDIVISIATLQYVYDLDLLFDEVFRVLKNGGRFIFEVPNAAVFWRRIQFLFGKLPRTSNLSAGWDAGVIHYFTYYDLRHFVERKGFKIEKVSCSGIFDSWRRIWVSFLGADLIFVCRK